MACELGGAQQPLQGPERFVRSDPLPVPRAERTLGDLGGVSFCESRVLNAVPELADVDVELCEQLCSLAGAEVVTCFASVCDRN